MAPLQFLRKIKKINHSRHKWLCCVKNHDLYNRIHFCPNQLGLCTTAHTESHYLMLERQHRFFSESVLLPRIYISLEERNDFSVFLVLSDSNWAAFKSSGKCEKKRVSGLKCDMKLHAGSPKNEISLFGSTCWRLEVESHEVRVL